MDGEIELGLLSPQLRADRVPGGGQHHIGTHHDVASHINIRVVYQRQAEISVNVIPEMGVDAPVGVKGRLDVAALPCLGQHLFHQLRPFFPLRGAGMVEIVKGVQTGSLLRHQLLALKIKDLTGVHPLQRFLVTHKDSP